MFTQSASEISYTADRWRAAANGILCLFLTLPSLVPVGLSFYFDGLRTFNAPLGALLLLSTLLVVGLAPIALAIYFFKRVSQPDRMTISTEGLTYSRLGVARHHTWSCLGNLVYIPAARGAGSYRMDVVGEKKPIQIIPDNFGSYCAEIKDVITAARQGRLIVVSDLHAKLVKEDRQLALVFLPLLGILFATLLGIIFFGHKTPHRAKVQSHLSTTAKR